MKFPLFGKHFPTMTHRNLSGVEKMNAGADESGREAIRWARSKPPRCVYLPFTYQKFSPFGCCTEAKFSLNQGRNFLGAPWRTPWPLTIQLPMATPIPPWKPALNEQPPHASPPEHSKMVLILPPERVKCVSIFEPNFAWLPLKVNHEIRRGKIGIK